MNSLFPSSRGSSQTWLSIAKRLNPAKLHLALMALVTWWWKVQNSSLTFFTCTTTSPKLELSYNRNGEKNQPYFSLSRIVNSIGSHFPWADSGCKSGKTSRSFLCNNFNCYWTDNQFAGPIKSSWWMSNLLDVQVPGGCNRGCSDPSEAPRVLSTNMGKGIKQRDVSPCREGNTLARQCKLEAWWFKSRWRQRIFFSQNLCSRELVNHLFEELNVIEL